MERLIFLSVFTIISLLLDIYFYQVIKKYKYIKWNKFFFGIYWFFSLTTLINFFVYLIDVELNYYYRVILFNFVIGNFISKYNPRIFQQLNEYGPKILLAVIFLGLVGGFSIIHFLIEPPTRLIIHFFLRSAEFILFFL